MPFVRWFLVVLGALLVGPVGAQVFTIPPGAYRTGADYHRRQPQPAGIDATYPNKRGEVVVVVPRGSQKVKLTLPPDSVWGYVSGKGRTTRIYRGQEYRLEYADTLSVYTSNSQPTSSGQVGGQLANTQYFFSRGLSGLVFPLTARYVREAYAASNPEFVAALGKLGLGQSLVDFDKKTGLFRITTLYREAGGR
ncbi:hypothetical protein [Hymenobacter armeniacus]|uniref:Uncharacterized protein n=1 Tax=Hymenobacter armeniacus TaxID=2771358 RepID=A0ABR8JPK8_9BACT|nr:hypothetical protein [Hymenobacter armeniacus]MBD2721927.1 hypothetical protein [Hymenobacter armeniacus]